MLFDMAFYLITLFGGILIGFSACRVIYYFDQNCCKKELRLCREDLADMRKILVTIKVGSDCVSHLKFITKLTGTLQRVDRFLE